jgi:hypothetical protein
MKRVIWYLLLVVVTAGYIACRPPDGPEPTAEPHATVGSLVPVRDRVEHAPAGQDFQHVQDEIELEPNHRLGIKDGGEAVLDFGQAMRVSLFNNSETTIFTSVVEPAPPIVHFALWRGGLVGEKSLDDQRQIEVVTPAGAKITIIATTFFVTYDANTEITTAGNFAGVVIVENAEKRLVLPDNGYIVIGPGQAPRAWQPLHLDADEFARLARELNSPLEVVNQLQTTPTPMPDPTLTPSPTETGIATATITPTPSRTHTLTPTPRIPSATYTINAHCRRGPGTIYASLRIFNPGDRLLVTGRNTNASWWQLDAGNLTCWSADSVVSVAHGDLVPIVPTPIPPTFTPTNTPTPTSTPTPTMTPTPTYTPTYCPPPSVTVATHYRSAAFEVDVYWNTRGGCVPFSGTLTARWSNEHTPYLTVPLTQSSGLYTDRFPCRVGTIQYTVTLFDNAGKRTSSTASAQVVCYTID